MPLRAMSFNIKFSTNLLILIRLILSAFNTFSSIVRCIGIFIFLQKHSHNHSHKRAAQHLFKLFVLDKMTFKKNTCLKKCHLWSIFNSLVNNRKNELNFTRKTASDTKFISNNPAYLEHRKKPLKPLSAITAQMRKTRY